MNTTKSINLVLLPGLDGSGKLFTAFMKELPTHITPHVISYPDRPLLAPNELTDWVLARLPDGQFMLLAESFSGLVALQLIPRIESRLQAVIFVGAFALPPRPFLLRVMKALPLASYLADSMPNFLMRYFCLGPKASNALCQEFRAVIRSMDKKTLMHRLAIIGNAAPPPSLTIRCPTSYLQGNADRLVPAHALQWFSAHIPQLQVMRIDAPHFMLQASARECTAALMPIFS